jgi:hypothetical protein
VLQELGVNDIFLGGLDILNPYIGNAILTSEYVQIIYTLYSVTICYCLVHIDIHYDVQKHFFMTIHWASISKITTVIV